MSTHAIHPHIGRTEHAVPPEPLWGAVNIRLATAADRPALERLAQLDSASRPHGQVLIGELRGHVVAALSLEDRTAIADPFVATAELLELLRLRAGQLQRAAA